MLPIRGVYEVVVPVKDLARAESFYCGVLGLDVGIRDEERRWLFLRAGGTAGMVVLQENTAEFPKTHFALAVNEGDIDAAASMLRKQGSQSRAPYSLSGCPRNPSTSSIPTITIWSCVGPLNNASNRILGGISLPFDPVLAGR